MDKELHVDILILIPMFKIYIFFIPYGRTDRRTDGQTNKLIRCGLGNLSVPPGLAYLKIVAAVLNAPTYWNGIRTFLSLNF